MITLHRQRYWLRLITVIVIISFIPQNITWAVPAPETETLAPTSEFVKLASHIDLEMAGVGHTFIQWIEKTNIRDINQLNALLKRNPQVQKDLFKMDIWTLFYPDRIELIGPKFTLTFLDASRYPQLGLCHIAKTNMRIDLYRHPRVSSPPPQTSVEDPQRVIVTDESVPPKSRALTRGAGFTALFLTLFFTGCSSNSANLFSLIFLGLALAGGIFTYLLHREMLLKPVRKGQGGLRLKNREVREINQRLQFRRSFFGKIGLLIIGISLAASGIAQVLKFIVNEELFYPAMEMPVGDVKLQRVTQILKEDVYKYYDEFISAVRQYGANYGQAESMRVDRWGYLKFSIGEILAGEQEFQNADIAQMPSYEFFERLSKYYRRHGFYLSIELLQEYVEGYPIAFDSVILAKFDKDESGIRTRTILGQEVSSEVFVLTEPVIQRFRQYYAREGEYAGGGGWRNPRTGAIIVEKYYYEEYARKFLPYLQKYSLSDIKDLLQRKFDVVIIGIGLVIRQFAEAGSGGFAAHYAAAMSTNSSWHEFGHKYLPAHLSEDEAVPELINILYTPYTYAALSEVFVWTISPPASPHNQAAGIIIDGFISYIESHSGEFTNLALPQNPTEQDYLVGFLNLTPPQIKEIARALLLQRLSSMSVPVKEPRQFLYPSQDEGEETLVGEFTLTPEGRLEGNANMAPAILERLNTSLIVRRDFYAEQLRMGRPSLRIRLVRGGRYHGLTDKDNDDTIITININNQDETEPFNEIALDHEVGHAMLNLDPLAEELALCMRSLQLALSGYKLPHTTSRIPQVQEIINSIRTSRAVKKHLENILSLLLISKVHPELEHLWEGLTLEDILTALNTFEWWNKLGSISLADISFSQIIAIAEEVTGFIKRLKLNKKRYEVCEDSLQLSHKAAEYFITEVQQCIEEKGRAVVCFATGDTPREMYRIIREEYTDAVDWSKVIAFHLDEYVFSPEEYPLKKCRYSYRYSLQEEIFNYLPIPEENIHFLNDADPSDEAFHFYKDNFLEEIENAGGIDLCILGIGKNGHIAFDEPGSAFDSTIRKVKLKFSTRWTNRKTFGKWWQFWSVFKVPRYAFTLGIREIMASKKIMLLARGKDKAKVVQKSLFGPVTEQVPASILQRHPDVRYFLDKKAFALNEDADEVEELGYRIFGHMSRTNLIGRVFNLNWWRDKAMYWGMRFGPIKRLLMKMIARYPALPVYKKIPLFWFGIGMRFIAPRFIAGGTVEEAAENILRLRDKKIDYTVDILGEAVTDEEEAEENKDKYIRLLEELTDFTGAVNLSLKLTSLVSRLDQEHKEIAKRKLREILRRAIELGAFITIDMEQYCYKDLTLEIYKEISEETEFGKCNNLQIVIQTYLRDSPQDIEEFIGWAKKRFERTGARASIRLVKGAYWDKEVEWAKEDRRPSPVWSEKWQTDRNYEDMSALLLQNHQYIQTVFGTHNVRSMARVMYEAQKNKIPKDAIEFQMLYGMGEPFQDALVKMGYRVRAYVPYGPLLKGLKYFTRRIEENTSQESFLLQSLSGRYKPSELLKEPGPSVTDYKKRFSQALDRLLRLSPKEFIPDPIKDRLKEFNGGRKIRYYSFDSLDRLKRFCRWRLIKPDELIVVRLILPEKHGKRLLIMALRFRELKEEILGETEDVNIVEWGKTYFLIARNFNSDDCVVKDEGIYLSEELREKKLGSGTFRLFVQRLSESGFGGYPYRVQIENPRLLHLAYEELDGRINTTNTGLTQIFVQKFEEMTGERYTGNPRGFLGYLAGLYRQGRDIDWKALKTPVEGTIPGVAEPRTPKERFEEMLSSSEMLKKYIEDGRIFELIPEWKDWVKMHDNSNFRNYHHLSPEEHLVLAFSRLESGYFWEMIKKYRLRGAGAAHLRRALFLHDFGKIVALQRDPGYSYTSHIAHPKYSVEMAERILLRLGYTPEEIADDILLIRYHEVLKNLAQTGEAEIPALEFVNLLKNRWNLRLLQVLQLVDAASVRHKFENSLSIGLERRVNEISGIIKDVLTAKREQRLEQEKRLLDYLTDIKRQNKEIEIAFGIFREVLDGHGINIGEKILQEAFLAMHRSHMGLPRKDERKTPFAVHPIEVATTLVDELGIRNHNWLIAALLHDVLEDTRTTVEAIELMFGKEVASIVRLISKPDIHRYASKHEQDVDFYHRIIYGADGISDRNILTAAQTIKVADRINNLRTLTPKIAAGQINETYEVFIHYFIGETEVPVDIKRALIKELIIQGKKWKILTPEQIGELEVLSRDIIEFKIPELRVEASPYNFIRGLVEYRQEKQPGTPTVLAFNGMSGVGRTTFAVHIQRQLQSVGKKVVVFDANDYLLPRAERDKVLRRAREEGVVFYEQRERFYDIDRFRREVWDRIKRFKESSSPALKFKLSGLYNRLTGELDAPVKDYEIDRDTIILIEGIHIFQEDLLPLYDATFLVYAPREVCLANVLEREKGKPEEYQQSPELIRERFELVDWPSYRKHLLEYWRASGFAIDNTDYRNRLVKKNPFPRYPEKAPDVPKEFTDPQERLNRNLENIFGQLKEKGINPYDISPDTKNIDIFRNLLAAKGIEQLFPSILLPDRNVDSLDYFLDQLTAQTNIVDLFFRLFAIYIQSLKTLPPIIFNPSFPQDLLLHILSRRKWEEAKFTPNFILYRSNGLYIEVPRVGSIAIGDQERQFVYRHFALRFIYGLLNRYNHIRWVRGLRELSKWLLHYFKPQRIISGEYMKGYRLIMEKAPHLITPTRIVEDDNLWKKLRLKGMARQNKALILQLSEGRLLVDYIHELVNRAEWNEIERVLEDAFNFLEGLFQYGLADLDPEVNIWENLVVTEDGKIKTCDAESITDDLSKIRSYCNVKIQDARPILELLKWRGIGEVLFSLQDTPNCFLGIIKTLIDRFGEENAERLIKTFLNKLTRRFDIKEYPWEQDKFFADTLERIRKENPKVVVFYHKHYPLEPLGDVVEVIKGRYPPSRILFVEFPHSYRPLGYALNSFQYLYSSAQAMKAGVYILKDYSPEENKKFGDALLRIVGEVEDRREEISRLHEHGLKTDQGKARTLIAGVLNNIISEITKTLDIDFNSMLNALARNNPSLRDDEELLIKKLAEQYPGLHFISLHGQFTSVPTRFEHERPYNDIHGTRRASQYHIPAAEKVREQSHYGKWGYVRSSFLSDFLRGQIDPPYFDNNISYTFFELPIYPFPQESLPIPSDELIKAVIGSYLLQDPYFSTAKAERYMDMDYFRITPLSQESRDSIAEDLREYLDIFLQQIEEVPAVIEGELQRGVEISIEDAIEMLRKLCEGSIYTPLPYVKGFEQFGNRLLETGELNTLMELLVGYLISKPPEYKITALKRKDRGLIIEKILQDVPSHTSPKGSPAECLKTLFDGRHFADNPITLKDLRLKRINPKTSRPYNVKTIRVELRNLITLGLVQFQRRRGRVEYYLTDRLRRAPPEAILEIRNIALTSPPHETPLLQYDGVSKLNKDEIDEMREKIREIIRSPKNRLIKIIRDSTAANSPDILAEYSIRAYGVTSNYPAVIGQLNPQDRNQLDRIKDYRLYIHDFQRAPKASARLSMFRSLNELSSVYGDQYVFMGNTLDSMGRLFLGNRLRQLIKLTNYPHHACAIQLKNGMLYRIWIFDRNEPDKIVDFRQLSTIEDINGTFRETFYHSMKKTDFDNLGDCIIKDYRLDVSGRLQIGTRDAGLGIEFSNCGTEIEVRSGQIKTVRVLDELGRVAKKADFILIYQNGELIGAYYEQLTQEKFDTLGDVTLKEIWLNSQGILPLDVLRDPAACFTKYPNHKAEVDIINKHVDRVRILDAGGSVIRECIFSLVYDSQGNLISSFWANISEDDFNKLTGTIKRIKTDSNGCLRGGTKTLGRFTNYTDTDAEVDVINGIVDKVRLLKDDRVIEEYEYSLIYDASGKLIDSFRENYPPQERMKLEKAVVKKVRLDDHGVLVFGGEYWGTFKDYPKHEVEFDVENGVVKEVRISAKDGIKTFLPVLIYKIQPDGAERLVDSFFEYYYPEKFAKLDNHVIRRFKLDSNGNLDIGGRIGPNKNRRRAIFYPYRDQEVIIYVKNGHIERVTDTAGNYIGKEGDYIEAKSYTGKGGSNTETHPFIIPSFEEGTAIDITLKPITTEAKGILLNDERFRGIDEEFVARSEDKKGFGEVRVIAVPNLPLDGHYGMGGEVNQHTLPTIYVPKRLYDYLLERHNKGDPDAHVELADYLYHKYVEARLTYLYNLESEKAHRIVDHSDYYKEEKEYISPESYDNLSSARKRLLLYIEMADLLSGHALEFVKWVLKSYLPGTGKRYLAICQRGANPLGVMLKTAIEKLGWTHLEVKDIYINTDIAGDRHYEMGVSGIPEFDALGANEDEDIFEYLYQQGLLDGSPITFIDTGCHGSIPWVCEKVIDNPEFWKRIGQVPRAIPMEAKLLFYNYFDGAFHIDEQGRRHRIGGHTHPIKGLNDSLGIDLFRYAKALEYDFPKRYQKPSKLVEREGRLYPDLKSLGPEAELAASIAEQAARDLVFGKIASGELFSDRDRIKMAIRGLLVKRQREEHKKDAEFRRGFEREIESQVSRLHGLVSDEEARLVSGLTNRCTAGSLEELDLYALHNYLRNISGLDLLDDTGQSYIGPTAEHVKLMPAALGSLARGRGNLNFFKDRFVEVSDETENYLRQMRGILKELYKEKEVFSAFVLAFLLHDYGLLLMQSGANSHARSGPRLLSSFLNKLSLSDRQKAVIKILVEEHAKLYLMFAGHVTPFNYEYSVRRLEECGISRDMALKMYALFLFIDAASCDSEWARRERWLTDEYVKKMLHFTNPANLDRFKENYLERRLQLLTGDDSSISGDSALVAEDDYVNRLWFNLTPLAGAVLRDLGKPNILKLLYLLAKIYRHRGLDPQEIGIYFIADNGSSRRLKEVLEGLTIEEIKICPDPMAVFPFKIKITEHEVVINLKEIDASLAFCNYVQSVQWLPQKDKDAIIEKVKGRDLPWWFVRIVLRYDLLNRYQGYYTQFCERCAEKTSVAGYLLRKLVNDVLFIAVHEDIFRQFVPHKAATVKHLDLGAGICGYANCLEWIFDSLGLGSEHTFVELKKNLAEVDGLFTAPWHVRVLGLNRCRVLCADIRDFLNGRVKGHEDVQGKYHVISMYHPDIPFLKSADKAEIRQIAERAYSALSDEDGGVFIMPLFGFEHRMNYVEGRTETTTYDDMAAVMQSSGFDVVENFENPYFIKEDDPLNPLWKELYIGDDHYKTKTFGNLGPRIIVARKLGRAEKGIPSVQGDVRAFRQAVSDGIVSPRCIGNMGELDPLTRSMAWHVLAGTGADSGFKGRVVYSLKALLESSLNDGNGMERLRALVERTRGRVFFYAGDYCRGNHKYDFLKDSIVTKATVGTDELTIFMLNEAEMEHLGLDKAGLARLAGNQFIVPVEGTRDVEDDILLGFELIRNNGNTEGLPSLFKLLLAEAVKEWLKANGRSHGKEDIEQILQMEVPETRSYSGDIEHAKQVLISL